MGVAALGFRTLHEYRKVRKHGRTTNILSRHALGLAIDVFEVRLDDVSRADAPATNMATQSFASEGRQVPFAFTLTVDRADIDPRHSYAVSARITDADGKLMFITDTRNSVTFGSGSMIDMGTLTLVKTH